MFQKISADKRGHADWGWLNTYHLFSFGEYFDPTNIQFGNLRVFNDDLIHPQTGFPTHPHREMEIVTIVLKGAVTHKDSMNNHTKITTGEVQRMTAGTLITHSEHNLEEEPLHLYQIWFPPHTRGLKSSYEQKKFTKELKHNTLLPVVIGDRLSVPTRSNSEPIQIHSNALIYLADWKHDFEWKYQYASLKSQETSKRGVFVYITEGTLQVNDTLLEKNDQLRISDEAELSFKANTDTSFIVIEVEL